MEPQASFSLTTGRDEEEVSNFIIITVIITLFITIIINLISKQTVISINNLINLSLLLVCSKIVRFCFFIQLFSVVFHFRLFLFIKFSSLFSLLSSLFFLLSSFFSLLSSYFFFLGFDYFIELH